MAVMAAAPVKDSASPSSASSLGRSKQGPADDPAQEAAGVHALGGAVGGAGALGGEPFHGIEVGEEVHGDRGQAHDGAVAGRAGVGGAGQRLAGLAVAVQGAGYGAPDVEAPAGAAQVAGLPPAAVALHLVPRVEAPALEQAGAEAQGHGGVVGPLAGGQVERAAAGHAGDGREG